MCVSNYGTFFFAEGGGRKLNENKLLTQKKNRFVNNPQRHLRHSLKM
jgi:hypothetical protein